MSASRILCFNVGSSSVRIAGFEVLAGEVQVSLERLSLESEDWRQAAGDFEPDIVAHRIVRGAKTDLRAEIFNDSVKAEILQSRDLAPTHDVRALELVESARTAFPRAAQIVVYDTAFHASMLPEHATYAVPPAWRERGIRRIGYHGLSCAYAAQWLAEHGGHPARAVHAHLGNGCSVTALRGGESVATTMGFTPLEGLVMGTRSGSIDPGAVLYLQAAGAKAGDLREALFRRSGLYALCGTGDMREIERRRQAGDSQAQLAFDVFAASAAGAVAQMAAAAGGIDALTFAGGIGLHSLAVREAICGRLRWMLGGVAVHVLDVQEERIMAQSALVCVRA